MTNLAQLSSIIARTLNYMEVIVSIVALSFDIGICTYSTVNKISMVTKPLSVILNPTLILLMDNLTDKKSIHLIHVVLDLRSQKICTRSVVIM